MNSQFCVNELPRIYYANPSLLTFERISVADQPCGLAVVIGGCSDFTLWPQLWNGTFSNNNNTLWDMEYRRKRRGCSLVHDNSWNIQELAQNIAAVRRVVLADFILIKSIVSKYTLQFFQEKYSVRVELLNNSRIA
jgi:hypothetical protein